MNLSQLVKLRNQLSDTLEVAVLNNEIDKNHARLLGLATDIDDDLASGIIDLASNHQTIKMLYQRDCDQLKSLISMVQTRIDSAAEIFFSDDYQNEFIYSVPDSIRQHRILSKDEEFETKLKQRINLYSSYVYPALEIGCRDGEWTKSLTASDPLYIADISEEFLTSAVSQFPGIYQGRVRKYLITDFYKIANLPNNQFNLIFSYNFFNYLSIRNIEKLLSQIFEWLRPGGTVLFTYNNADMPAAAGYAESYFMTYVPETLLLPMAQKLGFELVYKHNQEPACSFVELKKPGQLKSIKLGQTLGEIKYIVN
jgi:SAM-dependent methyltransferase